MPTDCYAKPVHVIEVEMLDCAGLPVAQHDRPTYKLLLGCMQFAEDVEGSFLDSRGPVHADETITDSRRKPGQDRCCQTESLGSLWSRVCTAPSLLDRRRQFTGLVLEIGSRLDEASRNLRIRCCLRHFEQRECSLASMEAVV